MILPLIGFLAPTQAHAQGLDWCDIFGGLSTTCKLARGTQKIISGSSESGGSWTGSLILDAINEILTYVNSLLGTLAGLATQLAEWAIQESTRQLSNVDTIKRGWTGVRNLTNLFFIFVLLIIAIATILRRESYNMKRLLPTLVIVALFINFSLLITQLVILPTNLFGNYFLDLIKEEAGVDDFHTALGKTVFLSSVVSSQVSDESALSEADKVFFRKFQNPEKPLTAGVMFFIMQVMVMIILLWFLYIMVAFVFVITLRTVVLMVLMVLAPIAFFFHVLPATASYARQWWSSLIKQSIMLPAMLFFVWIAVVLSKDLPTVVGINIAGNSPIFSSRALYILVLILFFLSASLIVAQQLGGKAAGIAINGARRLRGFVTGGIAGGAVAAGGLAAYYSSRWVAEKAAKSDTSRRLAAESSIYAGAVQQRLEKHAEPRKKIEERQSQYKEKYMRTLPLKEQAGWLAKNPGLLEGMSARNIANIVAKGDAKSQEEMNPIIEKLQRTNPEKYEQYAQERTKIGMAGDMSQFAERFGDFSEDVKKAVAKQVVEHGTPQQHASLLNLPIEKDEKGALTEKGEATQGLKNAITAHFESLGKTAEDAANNLENLNRAAAKALRTNPEYRKTVGIPGKNERVSAEEYFSGGPISGKS